MSLLAQLQQIPTSTFDDMYDHILNYKPRYKNMHLRQNKRVSRKTVLRYLHAMKADPSKILIEGKISGPDIYVHYTIFKNKYGRIQATIHQEKGSSTELKRLEKRILKEIFDRIESEKNNKNRTEFKSNYSPGVLYLKRWEPGSPANSTLCQMALTSGQLHSEFLDSLEEWKFLLFQGKKK